MTHPVGVVNQMLHEQDVIVEDMALSISYLLAGVFSAMQYKLSKA